MKHFTLEELCRSDTASRRGIDNRPAPGVRTNLALLVAHVLDPLREAYGKPIRVTSGYRCPQLNDAVGGNPTSDHQAGRAADIVGTPATRDENRRLLALVQSLGLPFDQLIDEQDGRWVHVSYRGPAENRHQVLKL